MHIYTNEKAIAAIPISLVTKEEWAESSHKTTRNKWLHATGFEGKEYDFRFIPGKNGQIKEIVIGYVKENPWAISDLVSKLPEGVYTLKPKLARHTLFHLALGWGLGAYGFKNTQRNLLQNKLLLIENETLLFEVSTFLETFLWVRDLINLPAEILTPLTLAEKAKKMAEGFGAKTTILSGEDLKKFNYPLLYAVGKGSINPPSFTKIEWGNPKHKAVTLVGKGITFDTGGLNIKPDSGMRLMKKDMGGAAHALGLGQLIMAFNLPIHLQILIPSAENAISGNAYRQLDILDSRKGLTIEIGHTDAEGRLVLADALAESSSHNPEILIDFATLTGAIRTALGPELPGFFTNKPSIAPLLMKLGEQHHDPLWHMPLFRSYKKWIKGRNADLCNVASASLSSEVPHAGAITAALFLEEFIPQDTTWIHIDFSAWNFGTRPGRPEGGEAMTLKTIFSFLNQSCK